MYRFRTKLDYVKYTDIEIRIFKYLELVTILTDSNNRLYVLLLKFIFYIGRPNKDLQYEKAARFNQLKSISTWNFFLLTKSIGLSCPDCVLSRLSTKNGGNNSTNVERIVIK